MRVVKSLLVRSLLASILTVQALANSTDDKGNDPATSLLSGSILSTRSSITGFPGKDLSSTLPLKDEISSVASLLSIPDDGKPTATSLNDKNDKSTALPTISGFTSKDLPSAFPSKDRPSSVDSLSSGTAKDSSTTTTSNDKDEKSTTLSGMDESPLTSLSSNDDKFKLLSGSVTAILSPLFSKDDKPASLPSSVTATLSPFFSKDDKPASLPSSVTATLSPFFSKDDKPASLPSSVTATLSPFFSGDDKTTSVPTRAPESLAPIFSKDDKTRALPISFTFPPIPVITDKTTHIPSSTKPFLDSTPIPTNIFAPSNAKTTKIQGAPSIIFSFTLAHSSSPNAPSAVVPPSYDVPPGYGNLGNSNHVAQSSLDFPGYGIVSSKPSSSNSTNSSSVIPVYTPGLLGNAYGGGFIHTPSIYVTKLPGFPSKNKDLNHTPTPTTSNVPLASTLSNGQTPEKSDISSLTESLASAFSSDKARERSASPDVAALASTILNGVSSDKSEFSRLTEPLASALSSDKVSKQSSIAALNTASLPIVPTNFPLAAGILADLEPISTTNVAQIAIGQTTSTGLVPGSPAVEQSLTTSQRLSSNGFIHSENTLSTTLGPLESSLPTGIPVPLLTLGDSKPSASLSFGNAAGNDSIHLLLNPPTLTDPQGGATHLSIGLGLGLLCALLFLALL